jgi:hypothetical protein
MSDNSNSAIFNVTIPAIDNWFDNNDNYKKPKILDKYLTLVKRK